MGLDITVYAKATPAPEAEVDQDGYPIDNDHYDKVWVNDEFPGRADPITDGIYKVEDAFCFHGGSYGGYNDWREQLAKLAGYPTSGTDDRHAYSQGAWDAESGPFWELINFSDCEGIIGSVVSAKLLKDFDAYAERACAWKFSDIDRMNQWFIQVYEDFHEAFRRASQGGYVHFH